MATLVLDGLEALTGPDANLTWKRAVQICQNGCNLLSALMDTAQVTIPKVQQGSSMCISLCRFFRTALQGIMFLDHHPQTSFMNSKMSREPGEVDSILQLSLQMVKKNKTKECHFQWGKQWL